MTRLGLPAPHVPTRKLNDVFRRSLAGATALALSLLTLSACGDDGGGSEGDGSLDSVSISAEPGNAPEVSWDGALDPDGTETEVLVEGEGDTVASGDDVIAHIWIGNGSDEQEVYSSYAEGGSPQLVTLNDSLLPSIATAVDGRSLGSIVAVASPAEEAYGEQGNPALGIGNQDSVLFVVELVDRLAEGPSGKDRDPAGWVPGLVEKDGAVTGFDFSDAPEPTGKLRTSVLVEGEGETVEKGQTVFVDYLGQVYGGDSPFDDSFSRGQPASFPIGVGQVVKGWDQSLVGQKVGSRVVVAIPPRLGYGKKGNEQAGIKGTDTLYFVVDVLATR